MMVDIVPLSQTGFASWIKVKLSPMVHLKRVFQKPS
jgi:hypothetical protein